ncbi:MAG: FkbM family methyltransferase [Actinomycetota bacterium]|nr:FkbM family methyltransferase [Actinomycetota bacterium]
MTTFEERARAFCDSYLSAPAHRRFVLGRGEYAASIAASVPIAGFVDDYCSEVEWNGLPVFRSSVLTSESFVVVASMLRPITALHSLSKTNARCLDYFAFVRFAGLPLKPVAFWEQFAEDYSLHRLKYDAIRARLVEPESRHVFDCLVEFRLRYDLSVMQGFQFDQTNQYFEEFLQLRHDGESFVDIGSYDGFTSLEFARRAPGFAHITAFEPSAANHSLVVANLAALGSERVTIHSCGLSDAPGILSFAGSDGSSSRVGESGDTTIRVERLDDLDIPSATMLKIDIEGAEEAALAGAVRTIQRFRPRLAVSVYHRPNDFWRLADVIDATGVDYELRMRHYTEGIDETVMFFLPTGGAGTTKSGGRD